MRDPVKRVFTVLLVLLVLATLPLTASADQFDLTRSGSISVQLRDVYHPEQNIGGTLRLHKVGDATVHNSSLSFVPTEAFSGSGISLGDVNAPGLADQLLAYAENNHISGTSVQADADGKAIFSGLETGLYLVSQETAISGYYKVTPFLVSLPMYDEASGWDYSIEAAPKVQRPEKELDLTVRKEWLDNKKNRPKELVVQLLKDGQLYEEVTLNQNNSWKYTWYDLNSYFEWDVREKQVPEGYSVTYTRKGNRITITNLASWYKDPSDLLIQTGQLNWPVPVLFGVGLLTLLLGLLLLKRRDDNRYEA